MTTRATTPDDRTKMRGLLKKWKIGTSAEFVTPPRIEVELERGQATPQAAGCPMIGRVVLHADEKSLDKINERWGGQVAIWFEGKEKTAIRTREKEIVKTQKLFYETHVNVQFDLSRNRNHPLGEGEENNNSGQQRCCPFQINLPSSLPSSTSYPMGTRNVGFRIQYKLCAKLVGWESQGAASSKLNQHQMYVSVQSRPLPNETRVSHSIQPTTLPVHVLTMLNRGNVTVGACIENARVGKGEDLVVHVACHNDSTEAIERVQIKVYEEMFWKADIHSEQLSSVIVTLEDVNLPGIERSPRTHDGQQDDQQAEQVRRQIEDAVASGMNKVSLRIPDTSRDTYSGNLIWIWHMVKIKVVTSSIVTNNPKFPSIPLKVGTPPAVIASSTSSPAGGMTASEQLYGPRERRVIIPARKDELAEDAPFVMLDEADAALPDRLPPPAGAGAAAAAAEPRPPGSSSSLSGDGDDSTAVVFLDDADVVIVAYDTDGSMNLQVSADPIPVPSGYHDSDGSGNRVG